MDMGELDYNKPQSNLNKAKETGKGLRTAGIHCLISDQICFNA